MLMIRFGEWKGMKWKSQRSSKDFKMRKARSIACPRF